MSVLTLASFGTSPGVTTAAVAMTLSWPRPVLLVEADASKPSSVLAGWLQGSIPADSGLIGVAQASFHRTISEQDVWDQAVELSGAEATTARWVLPAIAEPRAARGMRSFWADLFAVLRRISEQDVDVIIDAGRAEAPYGRESLWTEADHLNVVLRSDLVSVAATRSYLPELVTARAERGIGDSLSLTLVEDRAQRLPSKDVATVLGAPVRGRLPHAAEAAAHFGGGARVSHLRLRPYTRAVQALNASLGDALLSRREIIEKTEPMQGER